MNVYKIDDILSCEFLKIPKTMFIMDEYRKLSSDAKLTYALLYDRLSLSKMNHWINEKNEVFLIYTREDIAADLGITYKKAIFAFRELVEAGLICETRSGRGLPNKIYIAKPELTAEQAKKYIKKENTRPADSAGLDNEDSADMPNTDIQNGENGISRPAGTEGLELPDQHPNQTEKIQTEKNQIEKSQSVYQGSAEKQQDGQADISYSLKDILENCQLGRFEEEERRILYDAIERLFYSQSFRIGNALLPQEKVRSRLCELDVELLQDALDHLHRNRDRPVKNITAYVMSVIFNCITERYSLLHVDPYLNTIREPTGGENCVPQCLPEAACFTG